MSHGPTVSIIPQDICFSVHRLDNLSPRLLVLKITDSIYLFVFWQDSPQWARASSFTRFLDHTQRRTTVGMTPLDQWSADRRDLYVTIHNIHNIHIPDGIRNHNLSKRAAADLRHKPHDHWYRHWFHCLKKALWAAWYGPVLWMGIQKTADTGKPEAP
jgi:hypothetical protein